MNDDGVGSVLDQLVDILIKSSPSVAVTGMTLLGLALHQWVYVATIIYTLVATIALIKKHWFSNNHKDKK